MPHVPKELAPLLPHYLSLTPTQRALVKAASDALDSAAATLADTIEALVD